MRIESPSQVVQHLFKFHYAAMHELLNEWQTAIHNSFQMSINHYSQIIQRLFNSCSKVVHKPPGLGRVRGVGGSEGRGGGWWPFVQTKDIMGIREAVEDVTAAEFACSVEAGEKANRKQKRAVDYEKLLSQLNRRVGDLICLPFEEVNGSEPEIMRGEGMGRYVYEHEQRVAMLK